MGHHDIIIDVGRTIGVVVTNIILAFMHFAVEHICYLSCPRSLEETHYVSVIINWGFAFSVLRKIKTARHIEKRNPGIVCIRIQNSKMAIESRDPCLVKPVSKNPTLLPIQKCF
jgi:hypothetical protein